MLQNKENTKEIKPKKTIAKENMKKKLKYPVILINNKFKN